MTESNGSRPGEAPDGPWMRLDAQINTPGGEGLAGTTPASMVGPLPDPEQFTRPPDGRPLEEQPAWRRDFPIDWPQDHYVARRDFTKFMVLTSLAFAVGQYWIGIQNWFRRRRGAPPIQKVASLSQLAPGSTLVFSYPGEHDKCILIRTNDGELLAYSQKCTHLACAVVPRLDRGVIECPCHHGYFDLKTGRQTAGPPPRPLPRILLEVRQDDVYATGIEWRTHA